MKKSLEADTKRAIMQYLKLRKILHFRMNSGNQFLSYKGKTRCIRGHEKGTADILVFTKDECDYNDYPVWLEVKTSTGKQSPDQKAFQEMVELEGHAYHIVRSLDDVRKVVG